MRPLFVFTHPNHELAVHALIGRLRPHLVYLTDGGGAERVADTREALRRLGLVDRAHFLAHTEQSFYAALLDGDHAFFGGVAAEVAALVGALDPDVVYCDAVEFYNPVHDVGLPIVRASLGRADIPVFEIPLVYQRVGGGERYDFQRAPGNSRADAVAIDLTETETDDKAEALRSVYVNLRAQMGELLDAVPRTEVAREEVLPARASLPQPDRDVRLRYEWRGEKLRAAGEIERVITYAGHFLPVATKLIASRSAA